MHVTRGGSSKFLVDNILIQLFMNILENCQVFRKNEETFVVIYVKYIY